MKFPVLKGQAPSEVLYTSTDAERRTAGNSGGVRGLPVQLVTLTAPVDPARHLLLHLFPALQELRDTRP